MGGKAPGMAADATRMSRTRSRAFGLPLAAILPIFHMTGLRASMLVVPMRRMRPLASSAAMSFSMSAVTYFATSCRSGALSAIASSKSAANLPRCSSTSFGPVVVNTALSSSSYLGPRNAKGAVSAPVLMPVTILNSGRLLVSVQPFSSPAPKAPFSPPPEIARQFAVGN
jgi:hypothetical protein